MKCEEASEWFGVYRDLPVMSPERLALEKHVAGCEDCAEEFRIWEESADLIRDLPLEDEETGRTWVADTLNQQVMNRIYTEHSWFMPTVRKTYAFTNGFRRNVAVLLAGLIGVFGIAFLYTAWNRLSSGDGSSAGIMETAIAFDGQSGSRMVEVPVASLSDPIVLHVTPVMPEYWIALSMLGMIMMMLILNWFSRVRS
jgi:hypothetical protein